MHGPRLGSVIAMLCIVGAGCLGEPDRERLPADMPDIADNIGTLQSFSYNQTSASNHAVVLKLHATTMTTCSGTAILALDPYQTGTRGIFSIVSERDFPQWVVLSNTVGPKVTVAGISSPELDIGSGIGANMDWNFAFDHKALIALYGLGLGSAAHELTNGRTFHLNFTCSEPVRMEQASRSNDLLLLSPADDGTGTTVATGQGLTAWIGDPVPFDATSNATILYGVNAYTFGQLVLTNPEGEESWNHGSSNHQAYSFRGPRGAYEAEISSVGGSFWLAMASLTPIEAELS
jgi:hypothetical protein